jgi:hypothetical protein
MQKQSFVLQYSEYYTVVLGLIRTIARGFSRETIDTIITTAKLSREVSSLALVGDTDKLDLPTLIQDVKSARVAFQSKL